MARFCFLAFLLGICFLPSRLWAQSTGQLYGSIYDDINGEVLPFAEVLVDGGPSAISDINGDYRIEEVPVGLVNVSVVFIGYEGQTITEVRILGDKATKLDAYLTASTKELDEVVIQGKPFEKIEESPLSVRVIGTDEIERFPGGNRDVSRVIQSLPGVSTGVSYRNDIIVRGGSPNENRFYIDGIEIPTINHFTTQGASGGSNGYVNVDFIKGVDFYSGAFPASRGNALSSIMAFTFKEGSTERFRSRFTLGATEAGLSFEGPLSKKKNGSFIMSYRRSYQQLLFKAFGLPFLPTYNDLQFKIYQRWPSGHDLTVIGLGALDQFDLNLDANETEEQLYLLGSLPYFRQANYTLGMRYRKFLKQGNLAVVLSQTQVNNNNFKYQDNANDDPTALVFDLRSKEIEQRLRIEHNLRTKGWKIVYGLNAEGSNYQNDVIYPTYTSSGLGSSFYNASYYTVYYGFFAQSSRRFFDNRLLVSLGLRLDGSSFNSSMSSPFNQVSPRAALSYAVTDKFNVNLSGGRFTQRPPNTTMGYEDSLGNRVNQDRLRFILCDQVGFGWDLELPGKTLLAVEGFYKSYSRYPFLLQEGISLANLGAEYGIVGDAPADASSKGRAYGMEVSIQRKLHKRLFGQVSYTLARSEFTDGSGAYRPSSWDRRHVASVNIGWKLPKSWDIGGRIGYASGSPYTPYDLATSSLIDVYDALGEGVLDYTQLNAVRVASGYQLDIRIDKRWYFKSWSMNLYFDVRNATNAVVAREPDLLLQLDPNGNALIDPNDPSRYLLKSVAEEDGFLQPSIGLILDF